MLSITDNFDLADFFEELPCVVFKIYKDKGNFSFLFVNSAIEQELELSPGAVINDGDVLLNLLSAEHRDSFLSSLEASVCQSIAWKWEGLFNLPSGKKKWIQGLGKITGASKNTVDCFFKDITVEKHTFEMFTETGKLTKTGSWELDLLKHTLFWSEEVYKIHEIDPEVMPELHMALDFYPIESREIITGVIDKAVKNGTPWDIEVAFVTAKGNNRWVRTSGKAIFENGVAVKLYGVIQDITEKRLSEETFHVMFKYSTDARLLFGTEGIIDCNDATINVLGFKNKAELLARHPADFSPEYQSDGRLSSEKSLEMDRIAYKNGYHQFEWLHKRVNGELFPALVTINTVTINNKTVLLVVLHDITAQKNAENELIRAKDLAEQAATAKSQFLSTMSHEIRTPMNAVIGFTNLLLLKNPNPEQMEYLKMLKFSGDNLLVLINDILDFSKLEEERVTFEVIDFSVQELLKKIRLSLLEKAREKGLRLELHIDKALSETVMGDPVRLGQILTNLLNNAIKFTTKGMVSISVFLVSRNETQTVIDFEVTDTGIGIPEDKMESIFERFTQANEDTNRKYGGTGLGLAITKRLIELQGGSIRVESKIGVGSSFKFSLNFKNSSNDLIMDRKSAPLKAMKSLKGVKVLLAEDNEINVILVKQFMEIWNVECDVVGNGLLALQQVQIRDYNMVFMDLQMPLMDGYQSATAIRALTGDKFKRLPIIALTASAMLDIQYKAFDSGMNDYICKPFKPDELYHKIEIYGHKK